MRLGESAGICNFLNACITVLAISAAWAPKALTADHIMDVRAIGRDGSYFARTHTSLHTALGSVRCQEIWVAGENLTRQGIGSSVQIEGDSATFTNATFTGEAGLDGVSDVIVNFGRSADSPAIHAASKVHCPAADQRNVLRQKNRPCDIDACKNGGFIFRDAFEAPPLEPGDTFQDCPDCPTMVVIQRGVYVQGSPPETPQSSSVERPQRFVNVPEFAIGQTEVTFHEWDACVAEGGCSHSPSDSWGRGDQPVMRISWDDAQEYVAWLSSKTDEEYRLPSESEWEYATRALTTERFNTGDCITTDQANFDGVVPAEDCPGGDFRGRTLPVASFAPNAFGLYDTHGNVWELVQDCWNDSYKGAPTDGSAWMSGDCSRAVLRSGSWYSYGKFTRSAFRFWQDRADRIHNRGLRVARTVSQ